ncbi:probable WRKY transcription factor 13 isoform X2 [Cajanus cajan]|uniref:WRKY transcription factor 13 n=1 Tax=Cajanus cajan TaxID=3821 RepID=A0A151TQX1_CAJCA|nr:probable WRKY transcription factor 13 isoform X2 [Cajanus cajan]KYP69366.1 putative WRKY transcription factor 13 [Cajanus cajan]
MMSTTSQTNVNQSLFEEQDQISTQMGFIPFPPNQTFPPLGCHQSLKPIGAIVPSLSSETASSAANFAETLLSTAIQRPREDLTSSFGGGEGQLLSLNRSRVNSWAWEEVTDCLMGKRIGGDDNHHHLGVSSMKMKKVKARRKVREPRFCFKTMSDVDVLDDGYKWRKYGQKVVKNTQHPRSYYRCTQDNCRVKKRVERLAEDPRMVITTYEGRHAHSPSNELEDSQSPSELSNFFW